MKRRAISEDMDVPPKIRRGDLVPEASAEGGQVMVAGQGDVGQLGLGPGEGLPEKSPLRRFHKAEFTSVSGLIDIVEVCAGGLHTVCLNSRGEVVTFGSNDEGALGRTTGIGEDEGAKPGRVELEGRAVQISAGDSHTAALLEDGRVFVWGVFEDSQGTLGHKMELPTLMGVEGVRRISSGWDHLLMLTGRGEVFSLGCPEQGQLGRVAEDRASRKGFLNDIAEIDDPLHPDGVAASLTPAQVLLPVNTPSLLHTTAAVSTSTASASISSGLLVRNIWAGAFSSFLQAEDGTVYIHGLNDYRQLGHEVKRRHFSPTTTTKLSGRRWEKICADQHHTLALDSCGVVYALGRREFGRLGIGREEVSDEEVGEPTVVPGLQGEKCVDIACGSSCSFAVTADGALFAWGMGCSGQLGVETQQDLWEPTRVSGQQLDCAHVLAVYAGDQHTVLLAKCRDQLTSSPRQA